MPKLVFVQGLKGLLQILVRANNYTTFHEACQGDLELERTMTDPKLRAAPTGQSRASMNNQKPRFSAGCFKCGQSGHISRDFPANSGSNHPRRSTLPTATDRRSVHAIEVVCKCCNESGQGIKNCRRLKKLIKEAEGCGKQQGKKKAAKSKKSNSSGRKEEENTALPLGAFQVMMTRSIFEKSEDGGENGLITPV
uniref:CCHC-type domain-containing protein n=1 Tax=Bracon brevicornis TaxID=1563983 RepID=A0A6V7M077_9HYME